MGTGFDSEGLLVFPGYFRFGGTGCLSVAEHWE
jgi:hypothetical protein